MTGRDASASAEWAAAWMLPARYKGRDVPDVARRIEMVLAGWEAPVPDGRQRSLDERLHRPSERYLRTHRRHGAPRPGSEHELELQILTADPETVHTDCAGGALVDGINAVPLARDPAGGRRGNVEADMLLLTRDATGYRQWLVEAKTRSNNAWFAVIESLRQLKLFQLSDTASRIMSTRNPAIPADTPVTAMVLAPTEFYTAAGAKQRSTKPASDLITTITNATGIEIRLATWDLTTRTIRCLLQPPEPIS